MDRGPTQDRDGRSRRRWVAGERRESVAGARMGRRQLLRGLVGGVAGAVALLLPPGLRNVLPQPAAAAFIYCLASIDRLCLSDQCAACSANQTRPSCWYRFYECFDFCTCDACVVDPTCQTGFATFMFRCCYGVACGPCDVFLGSGCPYC